MQPGPRPVTECTRANRSFHMPLTSTKDDRKAQVQLSSDEDEDEDEADEDYEVGGLRNNSADLLAFLSLFHSCS